MGDLLDHASEPAVQSKLTSHDLKNGLRLAKAQGYNVFFEVGNDTGTKVTRHADAVAIGIWPSTGHQIHGYEIKVSRSDFLNEMKNPMKSWPVMRFCHRWSLLTPPGLVKVDELPPNWGLQTFDGKIMRTVKQAPMLTPEPLTGGFVAALVRRAGEEDASLIEAAVRKAELAMKDNTERRLSENADRAVKSRLEAGENAIKVLATLKEALGVEYLGAHDVGEYATIIKAVRKTGMLEGWRGLASIADSLGEMSASIRKQLDDAGYPVERKKRSA